jgi:hypothetical protein
MDKVIRSDDSLDYIYNTPDAGGLDAARGLIIGLAISQVFWIVVTYFLL